MLLRRLLRSIPKREDTEVIIVDDNSDPTIVDFNNFLGMERQDVKLVFDKKGGYGGYARNLGLQQATGRWVLFADSDDFFNYCLDDILNEYKDSDADVIYFNANSLDTDLYTTAIRAIHLNRMIAQYEAGNADGEKNLRYLFGEPWCKIVRRQLIVENNICFEERSIHNDTAFSYLVGYYAQKVLVDPRALYCVTDRVGSVSKEVSDAKKLERIDNFATSTIFFRNHHIDVREYRHFVQLEKLQRENNETYLRGRAILRDHGYTNGEIELALMRCRWRNVKRMVKEIVKMGLGKVIGRKI